MSASSAAPILCSAAMILSPDPQSGKAGLMMIGGGLTLVAAAVAFGWPKIGEGLSWRAALARPFLKAWLIALAVNWSIFLIFLAGPILHTPGDFCAFYAAGHVYLQSPSRVYDLDLQRKTEQALTNGKNIPFNHPPYEMLAWLPLVRLSFHSAFWAWRAMSLTLLVAALWLLATTFAPSLGFGIAVLIGMGFFPVLFCMLMGQDSILLLAIFASSAALLKGRDEFAAGAVLGLGSFKPELIVPIAAAYLLWRQWRFLGGLMCSGLVTVAASVFMVGISGLRELLNVVVRGQTAAGMAVYPDKMPNIRGLVSLFPLGGPSPKAACVLLLSILLLALVPRWNQQRPSPERQFALLIPFAVLVSYHLNPHDLSLLLLPVLATLEEHRSQPQLGWRLTVPLVVLFCTPLYLIGLLIDKLAVLAIFVAWVWYAVTLASPGASRLRQMQDYAVVGASSRG